MLWKYLLILLQLLRGQKLDLDCNEYLWNYVLPIPFICLRMWVEFDLFWKCVFTWLSCVIFAFVHFVRVFSWIQNIFLYSCVHVLLWSSLKEFSMPPKVKTHIRKCKTWIEFQKKKKLFKSCILPKRLQHPGMIDVCIFITLKTTWKTTFCLKNTVSQNLLLIAVHISIELFIRQDNAPPPSLLPFSGYLFTI